MGRGGGVYVEKPKSGANGVRFSERFFSDKSDAGKSNNRENHAEISEESCFQYHVTQSFAQHSVSKHHVNAADVLRGKFVGFTHLIAGSRPSPFNNILDGRIHWKFIALLS